MHLFPARAGLVVLVCALLAPGCRPSKTARVAPDFALRDPDGRAVRLSDYRGKVVLLNFWATWCGPCAIEVPWFVEFERRHKDQGFAVLGISMDEDGWQVVRPYMSRVGINYRVLLGNDEVASLYGGVDSLPTTFLIDREGKVAKMHLGLVSKSRYEMELNELLGDGGDRNARPGAVAGGAR
jgi:cytochrome c biogenesis protein CcmG/thiol:disulfide interchange protein DsbE